MHKKIIIFLLLLLHAFFVQGTYALSITNVSHNQITNTISSFDIQYMIDEPSLVTLNIYDDRNILIRSNKQTTKNKGSESIVWDGKDSNGNAVPPEAYHYTLQAQANGKSVLYDTTDITGNAFVKLQNIKWDKEKNTVSYTINKPARISIRVGIKDGGPLLATVVNWLPRTNGPHIEKWDGMDTQAQLNVSNIKNTTLHTRAYSFSTNTILVGSDIKKSTYVENTGKPAKKRIVTTNKKRIFKYMGKNAEARNDYLIGIDLPKQDHLDFYSGTIPIKITLDLKNKSRLLQDRFEPMLYVDGIFETELETGFFPLTWKLDTTKFSNGEHFITVNLRGYAGQFGVASQKLNIRNQ